MAPIELKELRSHSRRRNRKKSSHGHVPIHNFVAQVPLSNRPGLDGSNPKAECVADQDSLSADSNLATPNPFFYSREEQVGKPWSQWPLMATEDTQENAMPPDLGQQETSWKHGAFEVDDPTQNCDSTLLLTGQSRNKFRGRRNLKKYRKRSLQAYYHSAKSLLLAQWRDIEGLFSTSRRSKLINQASVKYDQIPAPLTTTFISEEQFWTLLQRFFGLLPLSVSTGRFPTSDEMKYIKNYLRSKPTPTRSSDAEDGGRDLVRICAKLTEFIFSNRESKRIFLGVNRGVYHRPQAPTWEIFQGFGLVEQFRLDAALNRPSGLGQDSWALVSSSPSKY